MSVSKAGRPISSDERSTWGIKKIFGNLRKNIRTDYGGQNPQAIISKDLENASGIVFCGDEATAINVLQWNRLVERAHAREVQQVAACRERNSHTWVELFKRFFGSDSIGDSIVD